MAGVAPAAPAWARSLARAPLWLAVGAGLCLLAMVVTVCAGVVLRYAFGAPLLGVNEIVQLIAVALAMLALPLTTAGNHHVRVDLFDRPLGRRGRAFGDVLARVLSVTVLWHLCQRAWDKAAEAAAFGDVTNMLELPLWPVYGAIFAGMALCALVFGAQIGALLLGWTHD
ncbi:TRAP transporter small permease [Sagittula sp. S175]|uniref:TRAP transporter small permease n=1 Tax=Sagittula sp. S175 TaxID=3415129 RepID=UPI003C7BA117